MRIHIIGGSGFIGTKLCKLLNKKVDNFHIYDKIDSDIFPEKTSIIDIRSSNFINKIKIDNESVLINLAAEHRDNVSPKKLYYDTNVTGSTHVCEFARLNNIQKIIFTSSVAVYGFAQPNSTESADIAPFNDYGKSKWLAEKIYVEWQNEDPKNRTLIIIRPTVVFGETNRGNVYNLFKSIATYKFIMIGNGNNKKSMAYVDNVASFIEHAMHFLPGIHIYNYADKPDLSMNQLTTLIYKSMNIRRHKFFRMPYVAGLFIGYIFDLISYITSKKFSISSIRVKKFCATSTYKTKFEEIKFQPPYTLSDGLKRTIRNEFKIDN